MTQLQDAPTLTPEAGPKATARDFGVGRRRAPRRVTLPAVVGFLLACGATAAVAVVHARGMYTAPIRFDDEGTYVDQARSLLTDGALSPYTYWYDHPPLGWMILAPWIGVAGLLGDAPNLVGAGRQLMLVLAVVAAALVYVLARRMGVSRPLAAVAVLAFGLSPLAVTYQRMVLLDNIATPLLLGALALALSPRRRLAAAFGCGLALAAAVLVKETSLLFLPVAAWLLWRNASPITRRMSITVFAIGFAVLALMYPLFALLKGELLPGPDHVSIWKALMFQLVDRVPSGSVFDPGSDAHGVVTSWLDADPYLLLAGVALAVPGLLVRRTRPVAAALVLHVAMVLRSGGYLPVPYVIAVLPLAALVVAGVVDAAVRAVPLERLREGRLHPAGAVVTALVTLLAATVATTVWSQVVPAWRSGDHVLMTADADRPYVESSAWLARHVSRDDRLLVDNVTRTDLLAAGFPSDHAVWFTKLDVDPEITPAEQKPSSFDYVVSTNVIRTIRRSGPSLDRALRASEPVATFGHGEHRIVVRKVTR